MIVSSATDLAPVFLVACWKHNVDFFLSAASQSMFVKKSSKKVAPSLPMPVNVRSGLPFQPHFRKVMNNYLDERLSQKSLPGTSDITQVSSVWATKEYAKTRGAEFLSPAEEKDGAVELPLPQHFTVNEELMKECCQARVVYHASCFKDATVLVKDEMKAPRCGETGAFFRREELVENLLTASHMFNFQAPFWIRSNHPEVRSGYLQLKPDSESITVPLTSEVFILGTSAMKEVPSSHRHWISPLYADAKKRKAGMNAFTGTMTKNPWVQKQCEKHEGGWITLDQLLDIHADDANLPKLLEIKGTIVEVDQWELYNSVCLVKPGLLSYDKKAAEATVRVSDDDQKDGSADEAGPVFR